MMLTPVGLSYQTYLASLVESGKIRRLTVQQACAMFLDIAEAILQLHKNGILHRDLKPDNIYLYPDQNALRACLADFNVSRAVQIQKGMRGLTQISYSGTAAYASPYLKTHNVADLPREIALRLDTYSLGVICYTILNNQKLSVDLNGRLKEPQYSPSRELSKLVLEMMEPDPHRHCPWRKWCGRCTKSSCQHPVRQSPIRLLSRPVMISEEDGKKKNRTQTTQGHHARCPCFFCG